MREGDIAVGLPDDADCRRAGVGDGHLAAVRRDNESPCARVRRPLGSGTVRAGRAGEPTGTAGPSPEATHPSGP
jgi:hypothetical protein